MPRFMIFYKLKGIKGIHSEECERDVANPLQWAEEMLERSNRTLKAGEIPRVLLGVKVLSHNSTEHLWEKANTKSLTSRTHGSFDIYRCVRCGMTGKRFGLQEYIVRDPKFRSERNATCRGRKASSEVNNGLEEKAS